eukprot:Gb_39124 [translate_table: standard]
MGGHLTVTSREHCGSTFSFVLPCRVPKKRTSCEEADNDLLYDMPLPDHDAMPNPTIEDTKVGYFHFPPRTLGSFFSSGGAASRSKLLSASVALSNNVTNTNCISQGNCKFPSSTCTLMERTSNEGTSSINGGNQCSAPDSNNDVGKDKGEKDNTVSSDGSTASTQSWESEDLKFPSSMHENREEAEKSSHKVRKLSEDTSEVSQLQSQPRVLLVEDNKVNVMVTRSMMKRLGHSLDVVSNGKEAVQAVQRSNYDLILMVSPPLQCDEIQYGYVKFSLSIESLY